MPLSYKCVSDRKDGHNRAYRSYNYGSCIQNFLNKFKNISKKLKIIVLKKLYCRLKEIKEK